MRRFNDTMDEMAQFVGMDPTDEPMLPDEGMLDMAEPVAESLNPLWGPGGESLGSTYGVEEEEGMMELSAVDDYDAEAEMEPEDNPEDIRDAYIYQMQTERDRSEEAQEATVEENRETRKKARDLRGVGF